MFKDSELQQVQSPSQKPSDNCLGQSASLLPYQYGKTMNANNMRHDAFYALSELFTFAASSENQFLNMMRVLINENISQFSEKSELSLANLTHSKAVVDEHVQRISSTISCLRNRGGSKWPRPSEPPASDLVQETLQRLADDFAQLLQHAQELSAKCIEGTNTLMTIAMLRESRKAIVQAESLSGLTKLAVFFVPTSFVCSFFGMNFVEFGQGQLSVWVSVSVLIPVLTLSAILCFSSIGSGVNKAFKRMFWNVLSLRKSGAQKF